MKTLLVAAAMVLAATAFAAEPKEGPKRGARNNVAEGPTDPVVRMVTMPKMAEKIGLTEEQKAKIKEINKENRTSTEDLRKKLRVSMKKQTELLKADKIDEAAVMAEIDKAFDVRKEMAKQQTRRIIAIKSILTPEQVAKALEELKNRPKKGRDRPAAKDNGSKDSGRDRTRPRPPQGDSGDRNNPPEE